MSVSKEEVKKIATLARLKFSEDEIENFTGQMNDILGYVEKLNELDTSDVEPLSHPLEMEGFMREDKRRESVKTHDALKNAPSADDEHFKVPRVIKR